MKNCGKFDAESLGEYIASGGFAALSKALFEMTPADVVDQVDKSGIRGRGGGGFPAGKKWKQVARQPEKVRYVVCNGDEGDPGAFMDGSVMEGDPFRLIEGMMLAAYAVSAQDGYIYVRAEYPQSVARLRHAIRTLEEAGLLGDQILGTDFSFRMHINRGAGAFCLWRGKRADRVNRGQSWYAACQAAAYGGEGTVGETDRPEQCRDLCKCTGDHPEGMGVVSQYRYRGIAGYEDILFDRSDREYRTD